jgi:hypothetical protein
LLTFPFRHWLRGAAAARLPIGQGEGAKMRRVFGIVLTLVLLAEAGQARADYVTNGGFETGNFSGWTLTGDTSSLFVSPSAAFTGNDGAVLSTNGAMGFLSETLTTPTGSPLDLSLFLASDGSTPNELTVSFGGTTLIDEKDFTGSNYTAFKLTVTPSSATNVLQIGFQNDNGFFTLDNVSLDGRGVAATPEPGSLTLLGLGGLLVGGFARRRRHAFA